MNDRELLELAAKAAGYAGLGSWDDKLGCLTDYEGWTFDPLTDDGDALRLAVKLYLWEVIMLAHRYVSNDVDIYAATRRAIVRAAAEIGKAMQ